jgi:hypothetical protein
MLGGSQSRSGMMYTFCVTKTKLNSVVLVRKQSNRQSDRSLSAKFAQLQNKSTSLFLFSVNIWLNLIYLDN